MMRTPASDTRRPTPLPAAARTTLSVRSWRTIRKRVAPREPRMAISRTRSADRASIRFAAFRLETTSTRQAAAMNATQAGSVGRPKNRSPIGPTCARVRSSGVSDIARSRIAPTSLPAAAMSTPSRNRPNTCSGRTDQSVGARPGIAESGSQTSAVLGKPERSGMTPTMVRGWPFTRTVRPMSARSAR